MKKTLKKILALVLSISIIISGVIAIGLTASAASVEYYTDSNGIKTGVKRVTLNDGTVYYDIADGKNYLDSDEIRFYKEVLTKKENGVSPTEAWANVAAHIIEDAGRSVSYPLMFEDYDYLNGKEDKSVVLSSALAGDKPIDTGFFYSEGLKYYNSLRAVQEEMASYHVDNVLVNDDKVDTQWFLKTVTGAETGFDFKESAENSRVYATVIKNRYSTIALAFYDFQLTPVVEENLEYKTAAEGYDDISDAQAAGVPGVTYTSHPTAPAYISYTTNPTRNAANSQYNAKYRNKYLCSQHGIQYRRYCRQAIPRHSSQSRNYCRCQLRLFNKRNHFNRLRRNQQPYRKHIKHEQRSDNASSSHENRSFPARAGNRDSS